MLAFVRGNIFSFEEENLVVDVGGIGYHVLVPPGAFKEQPKPGEEIFLYTYLQVREDGWQLFGFPEKEQLEVFQHLISVSGVGAKLGLAILNHFPCRGVIQAVVTGDTGQLSGIPGIGKKIAQRLVLELKEKFKKYQGDFFREGIPEERTNAGNQDVILALTQLGYAPGEAHAAFVKVYRALGPDADTQELIKGALKILGKF